MSHATHAGPDCAAWPQLGAMAAPAHARSTRELFADDPERFAHCSVQAAGLLFDYSRHRVTQELISRFGELADQLQLRSRIAAMFRGDPINTTEGRAVLHTALRRLNPAKPLIVGSENIDVLVQAERARMLDFAEAVRNGTIQSSTGRPFSLVVNIGIGGSDLGPAMAVQALHQYSSGGPRIAFVSNVDGCQLTDVLADAEPSQTLFIICSKTFSTLETRTNALAARAWVQEKLGAKAIPDHFSAVSVNVAAMNEFGVHPDHRFVMWDWVGGRYSIWSSIGVSLAIALGRAGFEDFLRGGAEMDQHFQSAQWAQNLPLLAGMLAVWNINFLHLPTLVVLPYDQRLARFSAYLQQLEMESNGKSVRLDGSAVLGPTCPVVWGEPGDNAQHSFAQLLHQGTELAAIDFLLPVISSCGRQDQQDLAIANCLAQAEALAFGRTAQQVEADLRGRRTPEARIAELLPHKIHKGNRPSTLIMFSRLDPATLGRLIALYEHKVFVQSVVWGTNAFDQWGVELGKELADSIAPLITKSSREAANSTELSSSLRGALGFVSSHRGGRQSP